MSATELTIPSPAETEHALAPISWKTPAIMSTLAALLVVFVVFAHDETKFFIGSGVSYLTIPQFTVPAVPGTLVAFAVCLLLAGYSWWTTSKRIKTGLWLPIVFGLFWVFAFLVWFGAGRVLPIRVTDLLTYALLFAVPLIFGSLAGIVCERVGVINIAIEGDLLFGAFLAATLASAFNNPWLGLVAGPVAGALIGCLLALFAVKYWVDHIIVGVVLNVLVLGLTNYLYTGVIQHTPELSQVMELPKMPIPLLSEIPVLGPVFFNGTILLYLMYAAVIALQFMLFRSRWGLRMRACGEHPEAADTVGIKVNRTRIRNTILGGAIAGLGGAFLTVGLGLAFTKEMSSGKGYIALAAMILGKWNPKGAVAACLVFGFALSAQQALGIVNNTVPPEIMRMVPYLITIIAVAGLVGKVRPPAMEGVAYKG